VGKGEKVLIFLFEKLNEDAKIPEAQNETDVGFDVFSTEDYTLKPTERKLFKLGIRWKPVFNNVLEKPRLWEIQVRPRSGLAYKHGITVLNSPGTIDQNYRDEIGVILINHGDDSYQISKGDRIAQFVITDHPVVAITEGKITDEDSRGGGLGSTGQ
jgi:dUTP pyrophosphatase